MKNPSAQTLRADVCLLVEGTYPFVSGGVSSWVHDIIRGHPELSFAVLNVGSHPGAYGEPRYQLPGNGTGLHGFFGQGSARPPLDGAARADLREQIRTLRAAADIRTEPSRVLAGLEAAKRRGGPWATVRCRPARVSDPTKPRKGSYGA